MLENVWKETPFFSKSECYAVFGICKYSCFERRGIGVLPPESPSLLSRCGPVFKGILGRVFDDWLARASSVSLVLRPPDPSYPALSPDRGKARARARTSTLVRDSNPSKEFSKAGTTSWEDISALDEV